MNRCNELLALVLFALLGFTQSPLAGQEPAAPKPEAAAPAAMPTPDEVRAVLLAALGKDEGACAVAHIRCGSMTQVVGAGTVGTGGEIPNERTIFEIGSISKVFTATLWRLALARKEVSAQATLGDCFDPAALTGPARGILLADLARHHSGLPRMPANFKPARPANPYADYTLALAFEALATWKPPAQPATYAYSNLGVGLLGNALVARGGADWASLIRTRITAPLELHDTKVTLDDARLPRYAVPRTANKPFVTWTFDCLAPAGALKSTTADLLRFLSAQELCADEGLANAFRDLRGTVSPAGGNSSIGFGWHIAPLADSKESLVWHNGGTGGSRSFCGFIPGRQVSIVVLANNSHADTDGAARQLLRPLLR